jgi:hypothetical protein
MKKHLLGGLAAVLVVGISASSVLAQCAFEHPKKAGKFQSNLVQAFVSCGNPGGGSNSPNSTTEGGVPSCKPPETFSAQSGNTATGWQWDETKGQGQVQFKSQKVSKNPAVTPANSTDLSVQAKLSGVLVGGAPANGNGALATTARATFNDRMNGDMTVVDFPANFPLTVTNGKAKLKTSADVLLNGISQPGLPDCTSIETVSITIVDSNGDTFANTGTFAKQ